MSVASSEAEAIDASAPFKKRVLFADDVGNGASAASEGAAGSVVLSVNRGFAKQYEDRKGRQLLARRKTLEAKMGSEEESSSEEEDEAGEALDVRTDASIMQVINAIRRKDPRIYEDRVAWFSPRGSDEEEGEESVVEGEGNGQNGGRKAYKDVMRERLLLEGAEAAGGDEAPSAGPESTTPLAASQLMYDAEQRELREAFLATDQGEEADGAAGDEGDGLFSIKQWVPPEDPKAEALLYKEIDAFKAAKEDDADAFLSNFISERRWREGSLDEADRTAAPVLAETSAGDTGDGMGLRIIGAGPISDAEDEKDLEAAETFESRYNFRFEEKGGNAIQTHARHVAASVRREDDRRRKAREVRKERRAAEKRAQKEELKRLKNERAKALRARLVNIAEAAGVRRRSTDGDDAAEDDMMEEMAELKRLGITPEMLEAEWDEEAFNAQMAQTFDDGYYEHDDETFLPGEAVMGAEEEHGGVEEGGAEAEADGHGDVGSSAGRGKGSGAEVEDGGAAPTDFDEDGGDNWDVGDDGGDDNDDDDEAVGETRRRLLPRMLEEKIEDELYKLDYEDTIGSGKDAIKCRFKYVQVSANGYGLSSAEILLAEDHELAGLVSLKKLAPYRQDGEWKVPSGKRTRWRQQVRKRLEEEAKAMIEDRAVQAPSDWRRKSKAKDAAISDPAPETAGEAPRKKTRRAGKKRKKPTAMDDSDTLPKAIAKGPKDEPTREADAGKEHTSIAGPPKKKRKKRAKPPKTTRATAGADDLKIAGEAESSVPSTPRVGETAGERGALDEPAPGTAIDTEAKVPKKPGFRKASKATRKVKAPKKREKGTTEKKLDAQGVPEAARNAMSVARLKSFGLM